jgi:hypothetical protein
MRRESFGAKSREVGGGFLPAAQAMLLGSSGRFLDGCFLTLLRLWLCGCCAVRSRKEPEETLQSREKYYVNVYLNDLPRHHTLVSYFSGLSSSISL